MNNEPVAIRYDFDGYGYQYMDSGSGSDWQTRVDGELLYADPACKHGVDDGACKECYQEATKPVAWINRKGKDGEHGYLEWDKDDLAEINTPLYTHPVKELHLSLQKSKQTGELLAVTYTDDEHRIVEVLWQRPPELTDEEIHIVISNILNTEEFCLEDMPSDSFLIDFARAILRKAQEK
jgi:hypothetical protein